MIKVYVAGPYTKGDLAVNLKNAIDAANVLADLGFAPFIPHLNFAWHMLHPRPYEFWMQLDFQFLPACEVLLRLPGESAGADREVELANSIGMPVFYSVADLTAFFEPEAEVSI